MKPLKYDPDRKWLIEVTEQQLYDIINDVEDIHRFLCGQMELFGTTSYIDDPDRMHELRDKLNELKPLMTSLLPVGAYYGWSGGSCPEGHMKEKIKRGYAIYRNLRHCIEKYRDNEWNVYQSPTLTCGVPLAYCYPMEEGFEKILEANKDILKRIKEKED